MNESLPSEEIDVRRGRRNLLALFAIALVPVLLAIVMYFAGIGVPEGRTNKGELLDPPRALPVASWLFYEPQKRWDLGPTSGWKLVFAGGPVCDAACQQILLHARQTHTALGREYSRVHRYYLSVGAPPADSLRTWLAEHESGFTLLSCLQTAADCGVNEGTSAVYLADPLGNIILRYTPQGDPRALLDDLKRLLKLSRVG